MSAPYKKYAGQQPGYGQAIQPDASEPFDYSGQARSALDAYSQAADAEKAANEAAAIDKASALSAAAYEHDRASKQSMASGDRISELAKKNEHTVRSLLADQDNNQTMNRVMGALAIIASGPDDTDSVANLYLGHPANSKGGEGVAQAIDAFIGREIDASRKRLDAEGKISESNMEAIKLAHAASLDGHQNALKAIEARSGSDSQRALAASANAVLEQKKQALLAEVYGKREATGDAQKFEMSKLDAEQKGREKIKGMELQASNAALAATLAAAAPGRQLEMQKKALEAKKLELDIEKLGLEIAGGGVSEKKKIELDTAKANLEKLQNELDAGPKKTEYQSKVYAAIKPLGGPDSPISRLEAYLYDKATGKMKSPEEIDVPYFGTQRGVIPNVVPDTVYGAAQSALDSFPELGKRAYNAVTPDAVNPEPEKGVQYGYDLKALQQAYVRARSGAGLNKDEAVTEFEALGVYSGDERVAARGLVRAIEAIRALDEFKQIPPPPWETGSQTQNDEAAVAKSFDDKAAKYGGRPSSPR